MDKFEYKKKSIEFEESSNPKISIDGEAIHVRLDDDANEFHAGELPYRSFKSVKELAEQFVEELIRHKREGEG